MSPHIVHPFLISVLVAFLCLLIWALLSRKATRIWSGGAGAAFINGFIEGSPVGSTAGAGLAAADGQFHADFDTKHLLVEAMHILAVPFFTGLADVRAYNKAHPFPNPFVAAPVIP